MSDSRHLRLVKEFFKKTNHKSIGTIKRVMCLTFGKQEGKQRIWDFNSMVNNRNHASFFYEKIISLIISN